MIHLEHSPLGGSGAHRFLNCAGSFLLHRAQLEDDEFENSESQWAKLGTAAHELCALSISKNIEPFEFIGQEFDGYKVGDPEGISLDAVQVYFNECRNILASRKEKGTVLIEETIKLPSIHPLLRGTVDFGFWSSVDGVFLRDYKNGEGVGVSPFNNEQLLYYAYLMIMNDEQLQNCSPDLRVSLGIVQPNFIGVYEAPEVWETTLGHVLDWGNKVLVPTMHSLTVTEDVMEDDFNPGDHCQFCPVLLDCPKMQQAFKNYAEADEEFIAMLTDKELDEFYAQRDQARRFMTALESTVYARLVGGSKIESAKLVEKRTNRIWKPGAEAALKAAFKDGAFDKKLKSPAQVEKISSRGKEISLEWGYKPDSAGLAVAPMSDPRPMAKSANASVFEGHVQKLEDMDF